MIMAAGAEEVEDTTKVERLSALPEVREEMVVMVVEQLMAVSTQSTKSHTQWWTRIRR